MTPEEIKILINQALRDAQPFWTWNVLISVMASCILALFVKYIFAKFAEDSKKELDSFKKDVKESFEDFKESVDKRMSRIVYKDVCELQHKNEDFKYQNLDKKLDTVSDNVCDIKREVLRKLSDLTLT